MKNGHVLITIFGLAAAAASADEVFFKSGDRLTGTIDKVEEGKMTFTSKVAGKLTLKMEDIKTFSTDKPIEIALAEGGVIQQKVVAAADGQIAVQPSGVPQPQTVAFANIVKINPDKPQWKGIVTVGATLVRGNTESTTASVGGEAARRTDNDRITVGAGYVYAKQRDNATGNDSTITDNWFAKGQYDRFLSKRNYLYGNMRYEVDRVADLDMRLTPGVGFGYQWIERADLSFTTEGGGSWVYEKYAGANDSRTYMAGRLAYHLNKTFNDHVKGFHNLEYIPSLERADTFLVNTDIGLRAALTANLSLEAKAQMAFNSQPAEGRDKRDLRYILGAGWTF